MNHVKTQLCPNTFLRGPLCGLLAAVLCLACGEDNDTRDMPEPAQPGSAVSDGNTPNRSGEKTPVSPDETIATSPNNTAPNQQNGDSGNGVGIDSPANEDTSGNGSGTDAADGQGVRPTDAQNESVQFEMTIDGQTPELISGVVYQESCMGFDGEMKLETKLLLVPWQMDCETDPASIDIPITFTGYIVSLTGSCFDPSFDTVQRVAEPESDGIETISFSSGWSHDMTIVEQGANPDDTYSAQITIFPKAQGGGAPPVGQLTARLPFCGVKNRTEWDSEWWLGDEE